MNYPNFDIKTLRSFITGIEMQNFAKAADHLALSTSAISAQMKRLEDQVGTPIFRKQGRGLALTDSGEMLLSYARRLLSLNDETALAMRGINVEGILRVGLQHDFAETLLPNTLGKFARSHPKIRIEVRIGRNRELLEKVREGKLDFALAWDDPTTPLPYQQRIADIPMCWLSTNDEKRTGLLKKSSLPLVVYDSSCRFRKTAIEALDYAEIPWHIALTSPDLAGINAGVAGGLGITLRTALYHSSRICMYKDECFPLPLLPAIGLNIYKSRSGLSEGAEHLVDLILDEIKKANVPA